MAEDNPTPTFAEAALNWCENHPEWLRSNRNYWESRCKTLEHDLEHSANNIKSLQTIINRKHQQMLNVRKERDDLIVENHHICKELNSRDAEIDRIDIILKELKNLLMAQMG